MGAVQLYLYQIVPRELEPGEAHRCLTCAEHDERGAYGPPVLDSIELDDGQEHTVDLRDLWFCRVHARERWNTYAANQRAAPARLRRLAAFRQATQLGFRDLELFRVAERWLKEGTVPQPNEVQVLTRWKCRGCGKLTAGRLPKGGDGSFMYPRRHDGPDGQPCDGNIDEADPVTVEGR